MPLISSTPSFWRLRHNTGVIEVPQRFGEMRQDLHLFEERDEHGVARQFGVGQKRRQPPFLSRLWCEKAYDRRETQEDRKQEEQGKRDRAKRERFPWRKRQRPEREAGYDRPEIDLP